MNAHSIRQAAFWKKYFQAEINDRIHPAPKELIDYILLDNRKNGFKERPKTIEPEADFMQEIQQAYDEIPEAVKTRLQKNLAGVFLAKEIGGTGYTEEILSQNGERIGGFVVLDYEVLKKRKANQWASWKESTPFETGDFEMRATIESPQNDNRKNAIQYILLHELAHVLAINSKIHPSWWAKSKELASYSFAQLTWKKFGSHFDKTWPDRKKVSYYQKPRLKNNEMMGTYESLRQTNFPTLYAATNMYDDWAETFTTYVHSEMMKKPFLIEVRRNEKTVLSYKLCYQEPRCREKKKFMEQYFQKNTSQ